MISALMSLNEMAVLQDRARLSRLVDEALVELARPSTVRKPRLFKDGDKWCALQDGVCGFGTTPDRACRDFDKKWVTDQAQGEVK